jgi:regulator of sirC expression with transglutaminase-like and TPR domain
MKPVDSSQLPFLLRLIDDSSPRVRDRVRQQLRAYPDLESEVRAQNINLTPSQRAALDEITTEELIPRSWLGWLQEENEIVKLEAALGALAQWQFASEESGDMWNLEGSRSHPHLSTLLDEVAEDFRQTGRPWHPEALSAWLFVERGLRGDLSDYYNASNSNLVAVIEEKRGIPISLSCVFILVGHRLGLNIQGCNFPGHFLAYARVGSQDLLFDCFDAGRLLSPFETNAVRKAEPTLLSTPLPSEVIIARVLRNLSVAYEHSGDIEKAQFTRSLLNELEQAAGL